MVTQRKDIVILIAPLHGVSATQLEIDRAYNIRDEDGHDPDVVIFSEGSRPKMRGAWKNLHRHKHFTGPLMKRDARGRMPSWDVVIVVKKHFKTIVKWAQKAAEAAEPLKIAPERWIIEWEGMIRTERLRVIGEHPHAAIHPPMTSDREKEYIKQAELFRHRIHAALAQNTPTVAGGDLNYGKGTRYRWAPESIYNHFNMGFVMRDVTWVGWSKKHFSLKHFKVIPPAQNGQDHNWLLVTLERRGG